MARWKFQIRVGTERQTNRNKLGIFPKINLLFTGRKDKALGGFKRNLEMNVCKTTVINGRRAVRCQAKLNALHEFRRN
jgi:hypothetical protein